MLILPRRLLQAILGVRSTVGIAAEVGFRTAERRVSEMADEPAPAEEPIRIPTGIIKHWCEEPGCERWGSFGIPRGKETGWYCGEHRDRE
jgi:hypothetical protein